MCIYTLVWASLVAQLVKNLLAMWEIPGSIPGSESSPGEGLGSPLQYSWTSPVSQLAKNLPAMWESWVQSLSLEDPLEEGKATHSSILSWRNPTDRGAWQVAVPGLKESQI